MHPELITTDTPTTNGEKPCGCEEVETVTEVVSFSLDNFKDWSDHDLMAAILAELIMMRRSVTDLGNGLAEIGNVGLGSLFRGMFGGGTSS